MDEKKLNDAANATPDPMRSLKNLSAFLAENPSHADELDKYLGEVALLFSFSQFLSNYSIPNPNILFNILMHTGAPPDKETLSASLKENFDNLNVSSNHTGRYPQHPSLDPYMDAVREFRLREILRITLRDILGRCDLVDTMLELSSLAEAIIENSLEVVRKSLAGIYGAPEGDAFSVISLGKLGGEELNFSSDIDLIFVYGTEKGETAGIRTNQGININKISAHEYYCKVAEALTRFLSLNTSAGFAYRVDLRLRPEGQRGNIALSLRGYEIYYESWGRAWERAMLLRARPVAGNTELGNSFMDMIRPFVYRKYLDFSSIDEIKRLKTRIDSKFKKGDIKRGYGGIREIEFFAQALQLIYGGKEPLLRERNILKVLHRLLQKALIGQEDYSLLSDNYRFLRTLEHRLQQLNDLQTHTLPVGLDELDTLAKKMGFQDGKMFASGLEKRRTDVRSIYDSLFGGQKEEPRLSGTLFDEELSDSELKEYLSTTGVADIDRAVRNIKAIKDSMFTFQTLRGRKLLGEILPVFVDSALKSVMPDIALNHLQSFAILLSTRESYLEAFAGNKELVETLTHVFSQSEYLSKMLMSSPRHLEMIGLQKIIKKSLTYLENEIRTTISSGYSVNTTIRLVKQTEEIRLGLLFLRNEIDVTDVIKGLTKTAEAVLSICMEHIPTGIEDIAVIGFGKLGGREIAFNSDLDLIFVCMEEVRPENTRAAEKLLRMLISYTKEGIAYRADTRLRPEGSKGPLVSSIESFKRYYSKSAAFWELQALLKARPVAGNIKTGISFINMARNALISGGGGVSASDIRQMRERILKELSKEPEGYDIKLGPGGIGEIEFTVQYLQLVNCRREKRLLVQGTLKAIDRLKDSGILSKSDADQLSEAYHIYRVLENFLRLRGENILRKEDYILKITSEFMGFKDSDKFIEYLDRKRASTAGISEKYLTD